METYELVEDDVVKNSIEYAYNTLNQMTTLTNNGIVTSYTYDANGNLTNKLLSTGVNTNYTYNKAGLMTYMAVSYTHLQHGIKKIFGNSQ